MALYSDHTDKDLLLLLKNDDKAAFSAIYLRYWDRLFYWAFKRLKDLAEAENQVQDVFVDLWQRRSSLELTGELNSYLSVALKYRIINTQAKQYRAEVYKKYAGASLPKENFSTQEYLGFEELKSRLASLVQDLPGQCRIAYQLREEGLSQKEIAHQMKISEHTVERHVSRALQALRKGLTQLFSFLF